MAVQEILYGLLILGFYAHIIIEGETHPTTQETNSLVSKKFTVTFNNFLPSNQNEDQIHAIHVLIEGFLEWDHQPCDQNITMSGSPKCQDLETNLY